MNHPPNCAGYLVSAPHPNHSKLRSFFTFPADFEPPWLNDRRRRESYRMMPLTADEYHRPLIDIVKAHGRKLLDELAEP